MQIMRKMILVGTKGRKTIHVVIDTGAGSTGLRKDIADAVGVDFTGEESSATKADGEEMPVYVAKFSLIYRDKICPIVGVVSEDLDIECLLGMDFLSLYNIRISGRSGRLSFR